MGQDEQQVVMDIETMIDDNEELEHNTFRQTGKRFNKNKLEVLIYEENSKDGAIKNLITIQEGNVTIKRSGIISMNQQFRVNQMTESLYKHPHGEIHMETFTNSVTHQPIDKENGGQLTITYTVKLNGLEERKHVLTITYQEEGS